MLLRRPLPELRAVFFHAWYIAGTLAFPLRVLLHSLSPRGLCKLLCCFSGQLDEMFGFSCLYLLEVCLVYSALNSKIHFIWIWRRHSGASEKLNKLYTDPQPQFSRDQVFHWLSYLCQVSCNCGWKLLSESFRKRELCLLRKCESKAQPTSDPLS